jgi:hypothetical protein
VFQTHVVKVYLNVLKVDQVLLIGIHQPQLPAAVAGAQTSGRGSGGGTSGPRMGSDGGPP